jgi:hypothetical protein
MTRPTFTFVEALDRIVAAPRGSVVFVTATSVSPLEVYVRDDYELGAKYLALDPKPTPHQAEIILAARGWKSQFTGNGGRAWYPPGSVLA